MTILKLKSGGLYLKIRNLMSVVLILLTLLTPVWASTGDDYESLTPKQKVLLQKAYEYGDEFNVGYSLAAIAWQESFIGEQVVYLNVQDPSAGLWHKHLVYALKAFEIEKSGLAINRMAQRLIDEMDFAASLALADVLYWNDIHKGNWSKTWASYNAGFNGDSKAGRAYSNQILIKVRKLKELEVFEGVATVEHLPG